MAKEKLIKILEALIHFGLLVIAFAIPLFFLPVTSEVYQFNKQILLYCLVMALFVFWTGKMVLEGNLKVRRTPLDLPLIIFLLVYFLATIFSQDKFVSLAGAYGRYHLSFASILAYVLLYFIASSNIKDRRQASSLTLAMIGSTAIASLVFVSSYFSLFQLPYEWAKTNVFNPVGGLTSLGALACLILPLSLGFFLKRSESYFIRGFGFLAALVLFFTISLINDPRIFILLAISQVLGLTILIQGELKSIAAELIGLGVAASLIILLVFAILPKSDIQRSPILPIWASWSVTTGTLSSSPVLGTGPSTYLYDFTRFKPLALNATTHANSRFDQAGSDLFEFLATVGILGTLALLFFVGKASLTAYAIFSKLESASRHPQESLLISATIVFIAALVFLSSETTFFVLGMLIFALLVFYAKEHRAAHVSDLSIRLVFLEEWSSHLPEPIAKTFGPSQSTLTATFFVLTVMLSVFGGFAIYRAFEAEVFYQKAISAIKANQGNTAFQSLRSAVLANPYRDTYHRGASTVSLILADAISKKGQLSEAETQTVRQLVTVAINEGRITTGYQQNAVAGTSRLNVLNWENNASVYRSLIGGAQGSETHAINTLVQAVALDPANSLLRQSLGNLLLSLNRREEAQRAFEEAISVSPRSYSAHYSLARVLRERGGFEERVVVELSLTLQFLPQESQDRSRIEEELKTAQKTLEEKKPTQKQAPQQATPSARTPTPTPGRQ